MSPQPNPQFLCLTNFQHGLNGRKLRSPVPADVCIEIIVQGFLHFATYFHFFLDIPCFYHAYRRTIDSHLISETIVESLDLLKRLTMISPPLAFLNVVTFHMDISIEELKQIVQIPQLPNLTLLSLTMERGPDPWGVNGENNLLVITDFILGLGSPKMTKLELEVSLLVDLVRLVSILKEY